MNCPFCNLNEEINRVIFEGKNIFVIPSNPRLTEGHLLVIPKRHIEIPSEMSTEERTEIFATVLDFQGKLVARFRDGCDIRQNYRPSVPENDLKVNHIHFHLIPRTLDDEIFQTYEKYQRNVFKKMTDEEPQESVNLFKNL